MQTIDYTQYQYLSDEELETRENELVSRIGQSKAIKYAHLIGQIYKEAAKAVSK